MGAVIVSREHPAVGAWRRLAPGSAEPRGITLLREREKGAVYRLDGAGPDGSAVIAKHCRTADGRVERAIYEEILPRLAVTSLRCFGHVTESDGSCWLFLELAEGVRFAPSLESHRLLAARWLAALHGAAASDPGAAMLPDRGTAHYRRHLRAARSALSSAIAGDGTAAERELLRDVAAQCDLVEAHWGEVEDWCAAMPSTLVHGDFRPKNVHVTSGTDGAQLVAMDWETAGWGAPAADVASIRGADGERGALELYASLARERWPRLDVRAVLRMVEVGKLFRRLAAIDWCGVMLPHRWEKGVAVMTVHRAALARMIEEARWA